VSHKTIVESSGRSLKRILPLRKIAHNHFLRIDANSLDGSESRRHTILRSAQRQPLGNAFSEAAPRTYGFQTKIGRGNDFVVNVEILFDRALFANYIRRQPLIANKNGYL